MNSRQRRAAKRKAIRLNERALGGRLDDRERNLVTLGTWMCTLPFRANVHKEPTP